MFNVRHITLIAFSLGRSRCPENLGRARAACGIVKEQPHTALTRPDAIAPRVPKPCSKKVVDSHGQVFTIKKVFMT